MSRDNRAPGLGVATSGGCGFGSINPFQVGDKGVQEPAAVAHGGPLWPVDRFEWSAYHRRPPDVPEDTRRAFEAQIITRALTSVYLQRYPKLL